MKKRMSTPLRFLVGGLFAVIAVLFLPLPWVTIKAAEFGYAPAQSMVGGGYEYGQMGLQKDIEEAVKWYRKAAEQGHFDGQISLCLIYTGDSSSGVPLDSDKMLHWCTKAAEQGHIWSQRFLAHLYHTGERNVAKDPQKAYRWAIPAAAQGYVTEQEIMREVEPELTQEQIRTAQAEAGAKQ